MTAQTKQVDDEEQQQIHHQPHKMYIRSYDEVERLKEELRKEREEKRDDKLVKLIEDKFNILKSDINKLDNKIDIVKQELKKDIDTIKTELELKIENSKLSNRNWVIGGALTTISSIIIAIIIATAKHWAGV